MPLSDYQRTRIVSVWTQTGQKMTMTRIASVLAMEGIVTTRQTIKRTITRWQKTGNVRDLPRSGPPKRVPEIHYRCIDEAMTRNDELTASALKDILSKQVFRVKKLMGRPKLELLASNGVATFVMPFTITLNARHTHIKQTQTYTHTHTSHRHTHTACVVCMCVHMAIHKLIMQWVAQLRALMHSHPFHMDPLIRIRDPDRIRVRPRCAFTRQYRPLLHVPITKYKIIPNPNPNPNTKTSVNTIPTQM